MWRFHQKLIRLSNTLSTWSKRELGNIFLKFREFEVKVRESEEILIQNNYDTNREALHELYANYIRFLTLEDSIMNRKISVAIVQ